MICPRCQATNLEGRRYCRACGLLLRVACGECRFENLPGDRFCGGCGAALSAQRAAPAAEDLPGLLDADLPPHAASAEPNRLAALRAELPPALGEVDVGLSDLDISELDDQFIQGEP